MPVYLLVQDHWYRRHYELLVKLLATEIPTSLYFAPMAQPVQNINHSAFRSMFKREKLSITNFNDWFHQLKLVLRVEKKMYVIKQPLPVAHAADSVTNVLAEWNALEEIGEIHAMLIEYEKGLPKKAETPQVMIIKGGKIQKSKKKSLKAKGMGKANGKGNDKQFYIPNPKNTKLSAKEHPTKDDTCYHCKEGFREARKLKQGALYLYVSNGIRAQVEEIRNFDLVLPNGLVICLDNCHYAPSITRVSKNNVFYFNVIPSNDIYEIDMHDLVPNVNSIYNVSTKRAKHNLNSTHLWHYRLAHISKKRIEKLQQEGLLKSTDDESFDQCVYCLSGKMIRKSFPHRLERATDLLRIIHTDMCGPLRHMSRQVVARYAEFFEKNLITQEVSGRAVDLKEIQDKDTSPFEITIKIPMEVEEIQSMIDNMVWVLVDLLHGYKIVGSKWIFKKKTDIDGIIHTYKARFVAKVYTQLYEVDYEEMFSAVTDIRAIRFLISIAAFYDMRYGKWM
nr:hypothetical protein [Tanacetum cinerariifolium]